MLNETTLTRTVRFDTLVQGPENLRGPTENSPLGIIRCTELDDDLHALSHAATKAFKTSIH